MLIHSRGCFSTYPSISRRAGERRRIESIFLWESKQDFLLAQKCWRNKEFFWCGKLSWSSCLRSSCATIFSLLDGDMFMHIEVWGNFVFASFCLKDLWDGIKRCECDMVSVNRESWNIQMQLASLDILTRKQSKRRKPNCIIFQSARRRWCRMSECFD